MKIGEHKIGTPDEFVRLRLSEDPDEYMRAAYSWAEDATWHEVLDRYPEMAVWVVHNKSVPHSILDRIIEGGYSEAKDLVTSKRKLTPAQIETLVHDPSYRIRAGIARHPKISESLLVLLQKDPNHWVRRAAYQTRVERKTPR